MSFTTYLLTTAATVFVYDVTAMMLPEWCDSHPGRMYRAVNGVKGTALAFISLPGLVLIADALTGSSMVWRFVPPISTLYASLDMAAILVLKRMHRSTVVHHIVVQILHFYMASNDYAQEGLILPIVVFACFSCIAFLANIRLALRGLPQDTVSRIALNYFVTEKGYFVYVTTCALNVVAQICLLFKLWSTTPMYAIGVYLGAAYMVFTDDLALISWMHHRYEALLRSIEPDSQDKNQTATIISEDYNDDVFESESESEVETSQDEQEENANLSSEENENNTTKVEDAACSTSDEENERSNSRSPSPF